MIAEVTFKYVKVVFLPQNGTCVRHSHSFKSVYSVLDDH